MKARYIKHTLHFKNPAGTSRGVLRTKETWYIIIESEIASGIGECGMFRGLSYDDTPNFEAKLKWACDNIFLGKELLVTELIDFPAIQIGIETAFLSLNSNDQFQVFPSNFSTGKASMEINGLVWMGDKAFMKNQIAEKLQGGFSCIKMKIGAIDFESELALLKSIRNEFSVSEIELRVDANGAFHPSKALEKLKRLSEYTLHSIEQPIKPNQWNEMARLCESSPIPIALDEELIGKNISEAKEKLLRDVKPQYIIIKPTLIGGFKSSDEWIQLSEKYDIGWWITSALESNVGLNAISQYTFTKNSKLPQGLGTGSLFTNNIPSPLEICNGSIHYNTNIKWDLSVLNDA